MSADPVATAYVKIRPSTAGFRGETEKSVLSSVTGIAKKATLILGGVGAAAIGAKVFGGVIKGAAGFERNLNVLQAVSNATETQVGQLSAKAKQLGADLTLPAVSAGDAAGAMTELAKGGLDVRDSLAAAKGTLQLAAAANVDNGTAATIAARALNSFRLEGDEAGRVADVLANAANVSTGEITDMALALQQSSAVAFQAGLSIEDTAAAISLMANAGVVGSDAGTSLKTFLQRLVPVTARAKKEVRELGIAFQDSNGNLLPLPRILDNYKNGLAALTPVQRQSALQQVFGTDAIRAANILIDEGAAGFDKMHGLLSRQGSAAAFAGARMKGLAGAWEGFTSNAETLAINVGEKALPVLTRGVKAASNELNELAENEDIHDTLDGVATVARTIGPPLATAAKAAGKLVSTIGAPAIAASFVVWKTGALSIAAAGVAQRLYAKATGALVAPTLASAAAEETATAATTARTVATVANTAALETNAAAQRLNVASTASSAATAATRFPAIVPPVITPIKPVVVPPLQGAAAFRANLGRLGSSVARFGSAAAGGPVGIALIGTAALAGGIAFLITRQTQWERSNERASKSLEALGKTITRSRDLRKQLTDSTTSIESDKIAVDVAKLNADRTRRALARSNAPAGSLDQREQILAVAQAVDQLKQAQRQLATDEAALTRAQRDQVTNARARSKAIDETSASLVHITDTARGARGVLDAASASLRGLAHPFSIPDEFQSASRGAEAYADKLEKAAEGLTGIERTARVALARVARETNAIPSVAQVQVVVRGIAAGKTLPEILNDLGFGKGANVRKVSVLLQAGATKLPKILTDLGFTAAEGAALATPVGAATGAAFARAVKAGAVGVPDVFGGTIFSGADAVVKGQQKDDAAAAKRKKVKKDDLDARKNALIQERNALRDAARKAEAATEKELKTAQKLLKAATKLRDTRKAAADAARADLEQAREALLDRRDDLNNARDAIEDAQQALADTIIAGRTAVNNAVTQAKQNLNAVGSTLAGAIGDALGKAGVTAAKPNSVLSAQFKALRDQLLEGAGGESTRKAAQQIAAKIQAEKATETKDAPDTRAAVLKNRIADLTNDLNKGSVTLGQFNTKLDKILASSGVTAQKIAAKQGTAAADQFRADIAAAKAQAAAIVAGPKRAGSGLEPTIVKPLDAVAEARRDNITATNALADVQKRAAAAAQALAKAQVDEAKIHTSELRKIRVATESTEWRMRVQGRVTKAKADHDAAVKAQKAVAK